MNCKSILEHCAFADSCNVIQKEHCSISYSINYKYYLLSSLLLVRVLPVEVGGWTTRAVEIKRKSTTKPFRRSSAFLFENKWPILIILIH